MTAISIRSALATRDDDFTGPMVWTGNVDGITLDNVYRFFNRVVESDSTRLETLGYRLPSLSVDDLVTLDGETYKVASCGFEKVDPPAPCGYCRRCGLHDDPGGCLEVEQWEREQLGVIPQVGSQVAEVLREDEAARNDPHYFDFSPGYATEMDFMNANEADDYRNEF